VKAENTDNNITEFISLYQATMKRLNAERYYYFNDNYFCTLLKECGGADLFFVYHGHMLIAASIVLRDGHIGHYHLSASYGGSLELRQNDFMIYNIILWAKENNLEYLHLGGGSKSLRNFKAKFSKEYLPYYVGSRIHDLEIYNMLCDIKKGSEKFELDNQFFPLYREGL
jgi:hypothetical protein